MNEENRGIEATFCDVRGVAGRKVVKLIFEIPKEMANAALERLGGYPDSENPQWCAIAPFVRPE